MMIPTSLVFFTFCLVVIGVYYFLEHRWQNRLIVLASYFFYASWDWRYLSLVFIITVVDYYCGIEIHSTLDQGRKKTFLIVSIIVNLSILCFFKYWNFFIDGLAEILLLFGTRPNIPFLRVILPIGMSFYIFKSLTYTIDIYRGHMQPTRNFVDYALFVSFFPALMAGPIDRASNLLPQITGQRRIDRHQITDGLQLIMWGLLLKVFVADNLAIIVDSVYESNSAAGILYVVTTWAFAFQIYADFAGYTNIAIGTAKCMGIELMLNFNQPYLAANPSEFWRRWHISLSSWLRDYIYIPLGGSRQGPWRTQLNLLITMLLCGLWHGAAWHYVIWGLYHGLLLVVYRIVKDVRYTFLSGRSPVLVHWLKVLVTFQLVSFGWIFFRAANFDQVITILGQFWSMSWYAPELKNIIWKTALFSALPVAAMALRTLQEINPLWLKGTNLLKNLEFKRLPVLVQTIICGVLAYMIFFHGIRTQSFIYMQF